MIFRRIRRAQRTSPGVCRLCRLSGWMIVAGVCISAGFADEPSEPGVSPAPPEGMLLLHTGRMVTGKILKSGDNYIVRKERGEMFVPAAMVKLQCKDLKDAYHKQREQLPEEKTVEHHLDLARWCLSCQLLAEARHELQDALQLDPKRKDARDVLDRLNDVLDPETRPAAPPTESASDAVRTSGFKSEEIESLGGLSRDAAQAFIRRVQPIFMNNCMLAGCHGPESATGFRLQRVAVGGDASRYGSERNLASVMHYIDLQKPRASPLLLIPKANHGRRSRPVFAGARGADQWSELQDWVLSVARSESARTAKPQTVVSNSRPPEKSETAGAGGRSETLTVIGAASARRTAVEDQPGAGDGAAIPADATKEPGTASKSSPLADPFDPAAFNRGEGRRP